MNEMPLPSLPMTGPPGPDVAPKKRTLPDQQMQPNPLDTYTAPSLPSGLVGESQRQPLVVEMAKRTLGGR